MQIAASVADLHSDKNNLTKETQLTEKGTVVNGRGDTPNQHDILTGSNLDGTGVPGRRGPYLQQLDEPGRRLGEGGPPRSAGRRRQPELVEQRPRRRRAAARQNLVATGGNGYFYCFAVK